MNPFEADLAGIAPAPRAANDFAADLATIAPKPRTGVDALLGRANDFARDLATVPTAAEANRARYQAQFGDTINADHEMRPVTTENVGGRPWLETYDPRTWVKLATGERSLDQQFGGRTWSELFGDIGSRAHAGVRSGVAALAETPVNLANAAMGGAAQVPGPLKSALDVMRLLGYDAQAPVLQQPAPVADFAAQQRELAARDRADVSMKAGVQADELAAADGFLPTLKLLGMNPSMIPAEVAEVGGQMVPSIVPGGATAQVLSQAAQAGSMNAAQVRDTLIQQGMAPDEAERRATAAFASSTALNALLPFAHKGGTALERLLAGEAAQPGVGFVQRIATPTLGEGLTEAASGGGDQIIMNLATDRPVTEGVGSATALEGLLGAGTGAGVGTIDALRAAPVDAAVRADEARHSEALAALAQDRAAAALDPNRIDFSRPVDGAIQPAPVSASPAARAEQFMADMRAAAPPPAAPTPNAAAPAPEPSARLRPDQSGAAATNPQPAPVAAAPETPAPQPTAPATAAPLTASAPAAPGPTTAAPALPPLNPEARARAERDAEYTALQGEGFTPQNIESLRKREKPLERDVVTGAYTRPQLAPTVQAAIARADAGQPASYAELDFTNLGGLNKAKGNSGADPHYRAAVDMLTEEVRRVDPDAVIVRKGGDEFGVVSSLPAAQLEPALSAARARVAAYSAEQGLDAIPHHKGKPQPGIGWHYGLTDIRAGETMDQILPAADVQVEARKEGAAYEQPGSTGAPGAVAGAAGAVAASPAGQAAGNRGGAPAPVAGAQQAAVQPAAAPEGVARAAPVVYHGTHLQFDKFQGNRTYFTSDPEIAAEYPKRPFGARVVESRLDMRNPLDFDAAGAEFGDIPLDRLPPEVVAALSESRSGVVPLRIVADAAEKLGYDGVIARNLVDSAGPISSERPSDVYVAFNPEQIRNAQEPAGPTAAPTEAAPAAPVADGSEPAPAGTPPAAETTPPAAVEPVAAEPAPAPAAPERPPTSTKNAVVDEERKKRGADAIVSELEVSNQETVDAARKAVEDRPTLGAELVQRVLNDGTGSVSLQDEAVLLVEKVRLMNARDAAADRMADESAAPEERAVAAEEWAQHEAAIAMMDRATRATGAEWGRLGQFRQRLLRMDYSLEAMERKARAAVGRPLTAEEATEVRESHEALQRKEKIAERTQNAVEDAEVETTYEALFKALHAEFRAPGKLTLMERLEKRAKEAQERLAAKPDVPKRNKQSGATTLGPQDLVDLTTIGAWKIAEGARDFAEWVAAMKDAIKASLFGEVEPQLPKIHQASLKLHERAGAPRKAGKVELASRDDLTQNTIYQLAQEQVEAGVRGPDAVMKAVHAQVAAKFPDVTERDVRRLFVNYGKTKFPSRDAVKTELRELRTLVRLQESIDREREGLPALKTGQQRDKATQAIRELQAQLNDLLKRRVDAGGLDEDALATYNTARATALRNQIADLEKEIATGEKRQRAKPAEPNEEVKALIAQRDGLRKQLDAIERAKRPQKSPEQRYNETRAKVLQKRIDELKRKLSTKDFAPKVRPPPPELSEANKKAQFEFWHTRAEFQNRLADWEASNWPAWKKALSGVRNGVNLARASMTSLDLSSTLKQGGFIGAGAPLRLLRSIFTGGRAAFSEAEAHARQQDLLKRPNAPLYEKYGLYLADDYNHDLTKAEEGFQSNWIRKFPLKEGEPFRNALRRAKNIGSAHIRGSNRYFNTQLNQLRADTFDALVATLGNRTTMTPERYKAIADYVNFATGRGKLGVGDQAASNLGTVFFAPRWVSSLFAMVLGYPAWTTDRHVARLVLEQYAKFAAGTAVVLALGALAKAGSGDDTPLTSPDPRSPEFGKMRFGRTRVDYLRGMGTVIQFMAREAMGETIDSKGRVQPLREGLKPANLFRDYPDTRAPRYGAPDAASLAGKFLRQKLAPVPATAFNLASGKNVNGMPVTPAGEVGRMLAPMTAMDVYTLLKNDGFPQGAAESAATILGMSAQYYDPNAWDEAKKR